MKISQHTNFHLLEDEKDNIQKFGSFLEYIIPKEFSNKNVVVNLLKYNQLTLPELLVFLKTSNKHRSQNKSFLIINDAIDPDIVPEEIMVVPTLQEAEDVIELEEIERDLGF